MESRRRTGIRRRRRPGRAIGIAAGLAGALAACGAPEIPESTLRATIEKRSFDLGRDRAWILSGLESAYTGHRYLWMEGADLSDRGRELLSALEGADAEGLDPEAYGVLEAREGLETLRALPGSDSVGRTRTAVDIEMRLSTGLLSFARDLVLGRLDPAAREPDWRIPPDTLPSDPLGRLRDGEPLDHLLESYRPRAPYYRRLVDALAVLRGVERDGGWPEVDMRPNPEIGWPAAGVSTLRARLRASEDPIERRLSAAGGDSDVYDADLAGAVKRFQSRHGIEPDGVLGPETLRELDVPVGARIGTVRLNLERLRWLPRELGETAIVVNVAGFGLELLEDGRPRMAMDVIVGRAQWATRLFTSRMDRVVLNPWWDVPRSILAGEILPAARRDPGYLARNGFQMLGGPAVTSAGTNETPALRVRQRPGPRNALGRVKFLFPNPYDIYLHDTPDDHLFDRSYRAFSHGCIRIERPLELARYILAGHTGRPAGDVDRIVESGRTVSVALDRPIDVYVVYLTAGADEDGTIRFYRDIYDRDGVLRGRLVDGEAGATG